MKRPDLQHVSRQMRRYVERIERDRDALIWFGELLLQAERESTVSRWAKQA